MIYTYICIGKPVIVAEPAATSEMFHSALVGGQIQSVPWTKPAFSGYAEGNHQTNVIKHINGGEYWLIVIIIQELFFFIYI